MSMFTRFLNRLRPGGLERDLRDEVQFHLDMRTDQQMKAGLRREDAMKRARDMFGDIATAIGGMRRARLGSLRALVVTASLVVVVAVMWSVQRGSRSDEAIPRLPPAPRLLHFHSLDAAREPPPPPPPPPTREQCLEQAKRVPRICQ